MWILRWDVSCIDRVFGKAHKVGYLFSQTTLYYVASLDNSHPGLLSPVSTTRVDGPS